MASKLREVWLDRIDEVYGWDGELTGYDPVEAPATDLAAARAAVDLALERAPPALVKSELARLRLATKSRAETGEDLKLMLVIYAEYLSEYPPDVVVDACRWWARNEKFWPAWSELKALLDRRVKRRRLLRRAISA